MSRNSLVAGEDAQSLVLYFYDITADCTGRTVHCQPYQWHCLPRRNTRILWRGWYRVSAYGHSHGFTWSSLVLLLLHFSLACSVKLRVDGLVFLGLRKGGTGPTCDCPRANRVASASRARKAYKG